MPQKGRANQPSCDHMLNQPHFQPLSGGHILCDGNSIVAADVDLHSSKFQLGIVQRQLPCKSSTRQFFRLLLKAATPSNNDLITIITMHFQKAISLFSHPTCNKNNHLVPAQVTSTVRETPKLKINHVHMKVAKYRSIRCPTASQVRSPESCMCPKRRFSAMTVVLTR